MISLRQAKLTDAIPATLAAQPWAQALAYAEWRMRGLLLEYAQDSQIYTALDTCPEMVLDALAVSWKVDWYDTTYPVEIKRSIIRSCMAVRRYMGTAWSAKKALSDVWPDSGIEEWFDYGGEPGRFRVVCNVTDPTVTAQVEVIENNVMLYKRESAHLDSISFMVRHGIQIGAVYEAYKYDVPRCGMIRCGTWPRRATLGRTEGAGLVLTPAADAFAAEVPLCGTTALPCHAGPHRGCHAGRGACGGCLPCREPGGGRGRQERHGAAHCDDWLCRTERHRDRPGSGRIQSYPGTKRPTALRIYRGEKIVTGKEG